MRSALERPGSRLAKNHLLLSFEGRKSGNRYTIPVNFRLTDRGTYAIGTEASWQYNFVAGAPVEIVVGGEKIAGRGIVLDEADPRRDGMGRALSGFTWGLFSKTLTIIEVERIDA